MIYKTTYCVLDQSYESYKMILYRKKRPLKVPLSVLCSAGVLLGTPAYAQEQECVQLDELIKEARQTQNEDFNDLQAFVTADKAGDCQIILDRIAARAESKANAESNVNAQSNVETESSESTESSVKVEESESLNTTVDVEQQATIEGQVNVTLPDPEVSIEQGEAEVSVKSVAPDVTISQGQPTIEVRQAQPIITVSMAQPTISVEQPAPEITITMPDPTVDVANAQPQVSVVIPEPRVTVRQGEPSLNVDLSTDTSDTAADTASTSSSIERMDDQGIMTVTATGSAVDESTATINYMEPESTANISYEGVEPVVNYVAAEPQVIMESSGEPVIDVVQSGDPKIMINQASDEQTANAQGVAGSKPSADKPLNPSEAFAPDASKPIEGEAGTLSIADIEGMDVVNARDEELGTVDRVVKNGNDTYVIIEHGGWFFGLNDKEVAFPVNDVAVSNDQLLLKGLSEEQIQAMPDYNYDSEVALTNEDSVEMTVIAQ